MQKEQQTEMDLRTPDSIVTFYMQSAYPGRQPHYMFMARDRMKTLFGQLLPQLKVTAKIKEVKEVMASL